MENPFFIVGAPRSGTTLLRFIISSHPRIYIPDETGFIPFLNVKPEEQLNITQLDALLNRIATLNRSWIGLVDDVHTFYHSLPQPTLMYLLDALYCKQIRSQGAVRWGDKTPAYVLHIPFISSVFPTAQFIHVIRDGRDVALSTQRKWGHRLYINTTYALVNWRQYVTKGQDAGELLGKNHYLEIRYEHLVENPQETINIICEFLEEDLHPAMLDHTTLAQMQIKLGGHIEVRSPISAASISRWKTGMTPYEKKLADRIAGPELIKLGYELANQGPFSLVERIKFIVQIAFFHIFSIIRKTLYTAGLITLNRNKRRRP